MSARDGGDAAVRQRASSLQALASDPATSAWVTANAGSGKTHVLVQRVLRLLLEGAPPSRILCLTFTKSAAANMADRVFKTLGQWTSLDDDPLSAAIARAGAPKPDAARLVLARQLFARTIESPGGLKIETIHGFCGRLLRMFPFEANVAAAFRVVEERESRRLLDEARAEALSAIARDTQAAAALRAITTATGREGLDVLLGQALVFRAKISDAIDHWGGAARYGEALRERLGLEPGEDVERIEGSMLARFEEPEAIEEIARRLNSGGANDRWRAVSLREALAATARSERLALYLSVFFTDEGKPRGGESDRLITKALSARHPLLDDRLRDEQRRLVALREKLKAARAAARSIALVDAAQRVVAAYARLKAERGLLDFDDLIERALALLARSDAAWVLYKLDSGIDHILVDEAQDTSHDQWEILRRLAEDFTSGKSAREYPRTFFAVGDDKQSIFSFQGAAPEMFAKMRRLLHRRHNDAKVPFAPVSLTLSYRSAKIVLEGVDSVFAMENASRGLTADNEAPPPHVAFRSGLPGLIEVWPLIASGNEALDSDWRLPLDASASQDPPVQLARRIASVIADWLKPSSLERVHDPATSAPRPIRPGNVLILVRTRNAFFEAMIRALKETNVKTLGADRLTLADHIAVMDLVAAGKAALCADDDLSLAAALKSPLFDYDDDDLIALAPKRQGSLADALERSPNGKYRDARRRLETWRERARALSPYDFYARLLGEEGAKRALLARLGPEASDAIEEFLSQALAFGRRRAPTLIGFLEEFAGADVTIKRDMEAGGEAVRVMTVHAAKGLEAPIVFLPDTCSGPNGRDENGLLQIAGADGEPPFVVWSPRKSEDPTAILAAREALREAARGEHRRLLYVAMTRAAERLIIAGHHGAKGAAQDCWRDMIMAGLAGSLTEAPAPWSLEETIWRMGEAARAAAPSPQPPDAEESAAPIWLGARAVLSPSRTSLSAAPTHRNAAGRGGQDRRLESGRLGHALLQYLPEIAPSRRREAGRRYLMTRSAAIDAGELETLLTRALAVLDHPALASLFGPNSRGEVAIAAEFAREGAEPVSFAGRIDRLAVLPDQVVIADFKSGRPQTGAEAPPDHVAQLALYRGALLPLYAHRTVRALLVWIDGPLAIEIEPGALDATLADRLAHALEE